VSVRKTGRNGAIFFRNRIFSRELSVTHYSLMPCFSIRTRLSHYRAWLRTSNVAASGFGFGRDCNGFTNFRHFN
ncbi:MAG TPA: hypothetical protein H9939_11125, partial [Candidatus Barnesiella merdigallinarum]|nr:hypothetical protein [Candidatus Barnesiella merdigallinarum]